MTYVVIHYQRERLCLKLDFSLRSAEWMSFVKCCYDSMSLQRNRSVFPLQEHCSHVEYQCMHESCWPHFEAGNETSALYLELEVLRQWVRSCSWQWSGSPVPWAWVVACQTCSSVTCVHHFKVTDLKSDYLHFSTALPSLGGFSDLVHVPPYSPVSSYGFDICFRRNTVSLLAAIPLRHDFQSNGLEQISNSAILKRCFRVSGQGSKWWLL